MNLKSFRKICIQQKEKPDKYFKVLLFITVRICRFEGVANRNCDC